MTLSVRPPDRGTDGRGRGSERGRAGRAYRIYPCMHPLVGNVFLNIFYQSSGKLCSDRMGLKYSRLFCKETASFSLE